MTDTRIAQVIRSMTHGLTPIAPLRPVRRRAGIWGMLSVLSIGPIVWLVGLRQDMPAATFGATLIPQLLAMGVLAGVAAAAALRLAVPGLDRQNDSVWTLGVLGLWPCALLLWDLLEGGTTASLVAEPLHLTCMRTIGTIALTPAILMTVMIRRGATLRPHWAAAMAGAAAAGIGAAGVALTCPIARVSHLLVAHAVPTLVVAGILSMATSWLVRRPVSRVAAITALVTLMSVVPGRGATAGTATEEVPPFRVTASTGGDVPGDAFLELLHAADRGAPQSASFEGRGPRAAPYR